VRESIYLSIYRLAEGGSCMHFWRKKNAAAPLPHDGIFAISG